MVRRLLIGEKSGYTPFSIVILCGWVIYGVASLVSVFTTPHGIDLTWIMEPVWLEFAAGVFIVVGSLLMIFSAHKWKLINTRWKMDYAGMSLAFGGWSAQFISALFVDSWTKMGDMIYVGAFMLAIVFRFIFTYSYEKFVRMKVFKWNNGSTRQP